MKCPRCDGSGWTARIAPTGLIGPEAIGTRCGVCGGSGEVDDPRVRIITQADLRSVVVRADARLEPVWVVTADLRELSDRGRLMAALNLGRGGLSE